MRQRSTFYYLLSAGAFALLMMAAPLLTGQSAYAGFTPTPTPEAPTSAPMPTEVPTLTPPPTETILPPPATSLTPTESPTPTPISLLPEGGGHAPPFWALWVLGAAALAAGMALRRTSCSQSTT
jgi:hypothetical protein